MSKVASEASSLLSSQQPGGAASRELSLAELSSWYIEEAMRGLTPVDRSGASRSAREAYLLYDRLEKQRYAVLVLGLVVTTLERPLWCLSGDGSRADGADAYWEWHAPEVDCPAPDGSQIYLSEVPRLPIAVGVLFELLCYGYLIVAAAIEYHWRGGGGFMRNFNSGARLFVATAAALDAVVFVAIRQNSFRIAPYFRMVLCAMTPSVVAAACSCRDVLLPFARVVFILVLGYFFVAWIFAQLMDDWTAEIPRCAGQPDCPRANDGFESLGAAVYSLTIAVTNQGLTGLSAPTVAYSRGMAVMWAILYCCVNLLVLNVLLATVYSAYTDSLKARVLAFHRNRAVGLKKAYMTIMGSEATDDFARASLRRKSSVMGGGAGVSKEQLGSVIHELNKVSIVPHVPPEHTAYLFSAIDRDGSGRIDLPEFYQSCDVIQFSFARYRTQSPLEHRFPSQFQRFGLPRIREHVLSQQHERIRLGLMLLNAVVILWESILDLQSDGEGWGNEADGHFWAWLEFSFSMVYLLDLMVTLAVVPFDSYFISTYNRLNAGASVFLAFVCVLWALPYPQFPGYTLRYFNIARLMILSSMLGQIRQIGELLQAMAQVVLGSMPVVTLFVVVMSMWVILAVQLYGGIVYAGNSALNGTDMMEGNADIFNYNDFGLGFFTLLTAVVTGGPLTEVLDAYAAAGPGGRWGSSCFHILQYYAMTCIMFNVFTSFVIDGFVVEFYQGTMSANEEKSHELMEALCKFDEPGYVLVARPRERATQVYRDMFSQELHEIFEEIAAEDKSEQEERGRRKQGSEVVA
tara:strand:- start:319 stop:2724 length:2406 start_codon:yes stop_codon:yes gene_type:complete